MSSHCGPDSVPRQSVWNIWHRVELRNVLLFILRKIHKGKEQRGFLIDISSKVNCPITKPCPIDSSVYSHQCSCYVCSLLSFVLLPSLWWLWFQCFCCIQTMCIPLSLCWLKWGRVLSHNNGNQSWVDDCRNLNKGVLYNSVRLLQKVRLHKNSEFIYYLSIVYNFSFSLS
jgi:hypothetical protein